MLKRKPKRPPDWVRMLPAGVYEIKELMEKLNLTDCAISRQLLKYGARREGKVLNKCKNLITYLYYWEGFK